MSEQPDTRLIHHTKETYDGPYDSDLMEQYKLYVESAENVSTRRVASSRYLLTLNSAIVALYGVQSTDFSQSYWTLLIPAMGITVSLLWYLTIKSHANLNRVKFDVIQEFEQHLPAAMHKYEWSLAGEGRGKSHRGTASKIEQWVTFIFIALHLALSVLIVFNFANVTGWAR